jgi:hypothetical protein
VTEILNPNSVYLIASLRVKNAEGPKNTVELYILDGIDSKIQPGRPYV